MKLQANNHGFDSSLPDQRIGFKIQQSAKTFEILSSGIYKDKVLAVIRELMCNAYDAHVAAGRANVPFTVTLPSRIESTFCVEDTGTGIDPKQIEEIFCTYGASTKSNSNDFIGALGLGCKSPFAYTKSSFIVRNCYGGKEYTYMCFIDTNGVPSASCVSTEDTDKHSGLAVEFAVRLEDISAFVDRYERMMRNWRGVEPILKGNKARIVKAPVVVTGTRWVLENRQGINFDHSGAVALMGNIAYPIDSDSMPSVSENIRMLIKNPFVVEFELGDISFTASRETLEYNEKTCKEISDRFEKIAKEMYENFKNDLYKKSASHISFAKNFLHDINALRNVFRGEYGGYLENAQIVEMIFGKTDTINFNGVDFDVKDLLSGVYYLKINKHVPAGFFALGHRGINNPTMKERVNVTYSLMEKILQDEFFPGRSGDLDIGSKWTISWRDKFVSKREMTMYESKKKNSYIPTVPLMTSSRKMEAVSTITFHVRDLTDSFTYYINDCGSTGVDRFKAIRSYSSIFVNFNEKVTSVQEAVAYVEEINKKFSGGNVVLLSTVPDNRPPAKKIARVPDTIKCKYSLGSLYVGDETHFNVCGYSFPISNSFNFSNTPVDTTESLKDLQAKKEVYFVIKGKPRKDYHRFYSDVSKKIPADLRNEDFWTVAYHAGLLKDAVDSNNHAYIFVLSESQYAWLKKRKVNLVSLHDRIINAAKANKSDFTALQNTLSVGSISFVNVLHNGIQRIPKAERANYELSDDSILKKLIAEYENLPKFYKDAANIKLAAECWLQERYTNKKSSKSSNDSISEKIMETYPMLQFGSWMGIHNKEHAIAVIDYINSIHKS